MKKHFSPYLCGGILFSLILEARKERTQKKKDQLTGENDQLTDHDLMKGLIKVINGIDWQPSKGSLIANVSKYRTCSEDEKNYFPFLDNNNIEIFNNELLTEKKAILERMSCFIEQFLDKKKCNIFVRRILFIIIEDVGISDSEKFAIGIDEEVSKSELATVKTIELQSFLLSVIRFILNNRPSNTEGRKTFEELFKQDYKNSPWKFNYDLNEDVFPVRVDLIFDSDIFNDEKEEFDKDFKLNETALNNKELDIFYHKKAEYPARVSLNYYNLFVVDGKNFEIGHTYLDRHLDNKFTERHIIDTFGKIDASNIKIIKSFPSLFVPIGEEYAYVGFINSFDDFKVNWNCLIQVPLSSIRCWHKEFGVIYRENSIDELNQTHWAIKNIDLFYVITNVLKMALPSIDGKNRMLVELEKKYIYEKARTSSSSVFEEHYQRYQECSSDEEYYNKILKLNKENMCCVLVLTHYYYGDEDNKIATISKELKIPFYDFKKMWKLFTPSKLILNEYEIATMNDFSQTLPGVAIINDFIIRCDLELMLVPSQANGILSGDFCYCNLYEDKNIIKSSSEIASNLDNKDIVDIIEKLWELLPKQKLANNKNEVELLEQIKSRY